MHDTRIRTLAIVGGGTAGWMAAEALARAMGPALDIRLVESEEIGTVGVGEATIPQIRLINQFLGLDEGEFLRRTQGTFKLGIRFHDWHRPGHSYIHAFSDVGLPLGFAPFHHYWLRARHEGWGGELWDYSLNAQAAARDRFEAMDKVGESRLTGIRYAYHFDAGLYAAFLREYAERLGVRRQEGRVVDVRLDGESGQIDRVVLADGGELSADFFIDCSGFRGLLIEGALNTGYEDWSRWLPCDRAVAVPCESAGPVRPYTQAFARPAGWQWRIPLQHRIGNGHVYCGAFMSDDEAAATLLAKLDGKAMAEPRLLRFTTGRRKRFWNRNCVALGLASGFMEPLESTSIHLVQSAISRLIEMFPDRRFDPCLIDEYNRRTVFEYERIRDFLVLHYKANERPDQPFWRHCREMVIPAELQARLRLFATSGRIHREADELFTEVGWLQVMIGQGLTPNGWHPYADLIAPEQLREFLGNLRTLIARAVASMPTHQAAVDGYCHVRGTEDRDRDRR